MKMIGKDVFQRMLKEFLKNRRYRDPSIIARVIAFPSPIFDDGNDGAKAKLLWNESMSDRVELIGF